MNWFVLYTKPRWEKKVADGLIQHELTSYCPLVKAKRQWSDRVKMVDIPLFASYVFVQLDLKDRDKALQVPGVVAYVRYMGSPAIVRDKEVEDIKRFLNEYGDMEVMSIETLNSGDRVRIMAGALYNHEGQVVQVMGKKVLMVLENLGAVLVSKGKVHKVV